MVYCHDKAQHVASMAEDIGHYQERIAELEQQLAKAESILRHCKIALGEAPDNVGAMTVIEYWYETELEINAYFESEAEAVHAPDCMIAEVGGRQCTCGLEGE